MSGHIDRSRQELEQAPLLFSDLPESVRDGVEHQEAMGEWTGERLYARDPKLYAGVVRMLGAGFEISTIAELLAVSDNTVRAVRDRETAAIAEFRAKQGVKRRRVLNRLLDRIEEKAGEAELKDAVIAYGILDDKERLDSGAPTQRIEIAHAPGTEIYEQFIKQVIDVEAQVTGFGGEGSGQRREGDAGAARPALPGTGVDGGSSGGAADIESDVSPSGDDDATGGATEGRSE